MLLKLAGQDQDWTVRSLEAELGIPRAGVHRSLQRLSAAGSTTSSAAARTQPGRGVPRPRRQVPLPARDERRNARRPHGVGGAPALRPARTAERPASRVARPSGSPARHRRHAASPGRARASRARPRTRRAPRAVDAIRMGDARVRGLATKLLASGSRGPRPPHEHRAAGARGRSTRPDCSTRSSSSAERRSRSGSPTRAHRPSAPPRTSTSSSRSQPGAFHDFEARLRERRFAEDQEDGVICRWRHPGGLILDAMPSEPGILGFDNRWQGAAIPHAIARELPSGARSARSHRPTCSPPSSRPSRAAATATSSAAATSATSSPSSTAARSSSARSPERRQTCALHRLRTPDLLADARFADGLFGALRPMPPARHGSMP